MPTPCVVDDSAGVAEGDAVCIAGWDFDTQKPRISRATRGGLSTAKAVFGVAQTTARHGQAVTILVAGDVASLGVRTDLGAGVEGFVATRFDAPDENAQCRLVRLPHPSDIDHIVGTCDERGALSVRPRAPRTLADSAIHNVRCYGAVGDGSTDDAQALAEAMSAAASAHPQAMLEMSPGCYFLARNLYVARGAQ